MKSEFLEEFSLHNSDIWKGKFLFLGMKEEKKNSSSSALQLFDIIRMGVKKIINPITVGKSSLFPCPFIADNFHPLPA